MLNELEVEHLQLLLLQRKRVEERRAEFDERLQDFVLRCRDGGVSARVMAEQLDVSPSSIQHWTELGRRRRDEIE